MIAAMIFAAAALTAPDVAGRWLTPTDHGVVEIRHCGASVCGRLMSSDKIKADPSLKDVKDRDFALRGRTLKGLDLLHGFSGGPSDWRDGEIYNPSDGGTYHATLTLEAADRLKVTGCIVAPFCKSEVWTRDTGADMR